MEIKYLGHSSFLIKTKEAKLVTDPFDPLMVGYKFPKTEADIVTISHGHKDHNQIDLVSKPEGGEKLTIDLPGEFEKKGIRITGFASFHDKQKGGERGENILYKIESEGVTVLHCGDLGFVPEDSFLDQIGSVDVLLVPVGGYYTIDAAEAATLVKKVEPAFVVPMHYSIGEKGVPNLGTVSDFLKKMGVENLAPVQKLVVKREELEEEMKVVLLEK